MKKTEFKVHTIYAKDDLLKMEKVAYRKSRVIGLLITELVFLFYLGAVMWAVSLKDDRISSFPLISGGIGDVVVLVILAACMLALYFMPYYQRHKILKEAPGGVLKANYYFYEKTFQYGWGDTFTSVGYVEIQELVNLSDAFYIKARDLSYWVKKSDFQVGNADSFLEFMKAKVKCKVTDKSSGR